MMKNLLMIKKHGADYMDFFAKSYVNKGMFFKELIQHGQGVAGKDSIRVYPFYPSAIGQIYICAR